MIVGDLPRAREAHKLLKENVVTGLSIGYRVKGSSRDEKSGARILTVVDLLEVSLVTFPANEHARVLSVKKFIDGAAIPSERDFESFLHGAGFSRKQAKGVVAKGYRALLPSRRETPEKSIGVDVETIARFRASIIQATEDNKMAALKSVFPPEKKSADVQEALRRFSVSLCHATEDNLKAGFNPNQSRVSRGDPDGGQWSGSGGSGGGSSSPSRQPLPTRRPSRQPLPTRRPEGWGHLDDGAVRSTVFPLDFIGGGGIARVLKPVAVGAARVVSREATVISRLRALRQERGSSGALTDHGSKRFRQRGVSDKDIDETVASAIRAGNTESKRGGRYNQMQTHYRGSNGLTVIIADEGRKKGQIITLYGKKSGGKF